MREMKYLSTYKYVYDATVVAVLLAYLGGCFQSDRAHADIPTIPEPPDITFCSDICWHAENNSCDERISELSAETCLPGTDCRDCGKLRSSILKPDLLFDDTWFECLTETRIGDRCQTHQRIINPSECQGVLNADIDEWTQQNDELTIATWNLEFFPKNDLAISALRTAMTKGVDLIALQEIKSVDELAVIEACERLGGIYFSETNGHGGDHETGDDFLRLGFIYDKTRLKPVISTALIVEDNIFFWTPIYTLFEVTRPAGQNYIGIINIHFRAGFDEYSHWGRRLEVQQLAHIVNTLPEYMKENLFIVGDLNESPQQIFDSPNIFSEMPEEWRLETLELSREYARGEISTTGNYTTLVDHIIRREASSNKPQTDTSVHAWPLHLSIDDYTEKISDHIPIVIQVSLSGER